MCACVWTVCSPSHVSTTGHYIPNLAKFIVDRNPSAPVKLQLKGILVGVCFSLSSLLFCVWILHFSPLVGCASRKSMDGFFTHTRGHHYLTALSMYLGSEIR